MDDIELILTYDAEKFALSCLVRNKSTLPIRIGKLNLANIRIRHMSNPDVFADAKFSYHIPNSGAVIEVSGGDSIVFDLEILRNFTFDVAGRYHALALYNSQGFAERFATPSDGTVDPLSHLATLTPLQAVSNAVEFDVTDNSVEQSRVQPTWSIEYVDDNVLIRQIRKLWRRFFGASQP